MSERQRLSVGFIGVGTIAAAVATAILNCPNAATIDVVLSPRSAKRSDGLAARYRQARVGTDNQAVVDASDIVFVAVLPSQVAEVCSTLRFRADQVIVGLPGGWPPSRLAEHVAPATTVCQLIPLPMIALGVGPILLFPSVPVVERLLAACGDLVVMEREADLSILGCASAVMSSFFALQNAVIEWATGGGLDRTMATGYVTALFHGLATESMATEPATLRDAVHEHETPGGFNEHIRRALEEAGFFAELSRQLDHVRSTRFPDS